MGTGDLFLGIQQPGREVYYSLLSNGEVSNVYMFSNTSTLPSFNGVVRNEGLFTFIIIIIYEPG
jgi:hypothetical protein